MKILIAPDAFKGSLSALEVATRLRNGMLAADASLDCVLLPLADGGEGSVAAAISAGFRAVEITVDGPTGFAHRATFALSGSTEHSGTSNPHATSSNTPSGTTTSDTTTSDTTTDTRPDTALVDVGSTCGLGTLPGGRLEPFRSSSFGLGQAIRAALGEKPRRIIVALGGSASTDGGIGMLAALGAVFRDREGTVVRADGAALDSIAVIDTSALVDFGDTAILVASDVINPLIGVQGAAAVFGRQKGAGPDDIVRLDAGLSALVDLLARSGFPTAPRLAMAPGSGSAGGLGFACLLLGATIESGAEYFLELLGFDHHLVGCDLVVTGEGRLDEQTASGKLVGAVARRAVGVPVIAVAGRVRIAAADLARLNLTGAIALSDLTSEATADDPDLTGRLLETIGRMIAEQHPAPTADPGVPVSS